MWVAKSCGLVVPQSNKREKETEREGKGDGERGGEGDSDIQNPAVSLGPGTEQRVWVFRRDPGSPVPTPPPPCSTKRGCLFNRLLGSPFGEVLHPNLGGPIWRWRKLCSRERPEGVHRSNFLWWSERLIYESCIPEFVGRMCIYLCQFFQRSLSPNTSKITWAS